MEYSFNNSVAVVYGVEEAVMVHNFVHWIDKNRANGRHLYKNTYWTYNSIKAFTEIFPFWTKRQIERILNSLLKQNGIISDEFNEKGYDRTRWYAISDPMIFEYYGLDSEEFYISPNGEMDTTKQLNAFHQTGTPIPDNKPYSKQGLDKSKPNGVVKISDTQKCQMFIDSFNTIRGTKFKKNKALANQLAARLRDGYTSKEIFAALRNAMADDYHKENNFKHLTPEFILRADKLEKFINVAPVVPATEKRQLVH